MKGEASKENSETPTGKFPEPSPEKAETKGEGTIDASGDLETGKAVEETKKQIVLGEETNVSKPKTTDTEAAAAAAVPDSKSTIIGSRQSSKAPLTNSTSIPGAFAISNPLSDDPIAARIRESQSSYTEASPVPAANMTLQSQTTGAGTLTSNTFSSTNGDIAAELISVAVADPIEDNNSEGTSNQSGGNNGRSEHQSKVRVIVSVAVAILVGLVVVLCIVLVRQGNGDDSSIPTGNKDEEIPPSDYDAFVQRREEMIDFLRDLTDPDAFNPDHPNASADRIAALQWIVEEDPMRLEIPDSNENENDPLVWKLLERYVLALFYFSTNGDEWTNNFLFLSEFDVCRWSKAYGDDGFYDYTEIDVEGVACDEDERVNQIRLYWNNLSGTIPDELSVFSGNLKQFLLGGGSMTGTIPSVFGKFSQLVNLGLNDHCFSGTIPEEVNQLPSLEILTYYHNNYQLLGSLEDFCDSPEAYREGVVTVISDSNVECSCCTLCHPNRFECEDQINNITWPSPNIYDISAYDSQENVIQFTKECVNDVQRQWIADECPCVINTSTEPGEYAGQCNNCTSPIAQPSYGN